MNLAKFSVSLVNSVPITLSTNTNRSDPMEYTSDSQPKQEPTELMKDVDTGTTNSLTSTTTIKTTTDQNITLPTLESVLTTSQRELNDGTLSQKFGARTSKICRRTVVIWSC
jgi:hypothetical protein